MANRPSIPPLPRPTAGDAESMALWANQLVAALQQTIAIIQSPGGGRVPYAMTNATTLRTLNTATATLTQTAEVLATLIVDLQAKGTIN